MSDIKAQDSKVEAAPKIRNYPVKDIPEGYYFSDVVYLDKQFVLAAPEMPFTKDIIKALEEWEFNEVYSTGVPNKDYAAEYTGNANRAEISGISTISDSDKVSKADEFYTGFLNYVESLFEEVTEEDKLDFKSVAEKMKSVCDYIKEDRRFILRVQKFNNSGQGNNFLASHAAKSTILSIIIGSYLKLPNHRLIELGVAALLHEIGMIKLPTHIYLSNRPLDFNERKAIISHPVLSYNLLKNYDFPLTVTLAALEHHERENGSGYPRKLTGDKISLYAKIIAVACSYEALSAQRPHKNAKDGYTGMLELLKNDGKQYDDVVVRALVFSLSIYPIGLYVLLSSGRKGQVVDVKAENPRFPIVQIFGELNPDGKNKVIETAQDGIHIVRPLTREEIGTD